MTICGSADAREMKLDREVRYQTDFFAGLLFFALLLISEAVGKLEGLEELKVKSEE